MAGNPHAEPNASGPVWRLVVRNELAAVGKANESLELFLQRSGVDQEVVFSVLLALEEVLTNIIKYGYDDELEHEVLLEARVLPGEIVLEASDDGHEFDPLSMAPPDLDAPIEERRIGGLGIHLLRNIAQSLSYRRVGGKNVLTLTFRQRPGNQEPKTGDSHASAD